MRESERMGAFLILCLVTIFGFFPRAVEAPHAFLASLPGGEPPAREARILFAGDMMFDRYIRTMAEKNGDENSPFVKGGA